MQSVLISSNVYLGKQGNIILFNVFNLCIFVSTLVCYNLKLLNVIKLK